MEYHGIEVKQINLLSHSGHAKPLVGEDVLGAVVCNDSGQHLEAYGRFFVRKMKPTDDCSEWRSNSLMEMLHDQTKYYLSTYNPINRTQHYRHFFT